MSFEIDRPVHFLPQAAYLKEDMGFPGMEFGHHHQHQHEQNDSIVYSPTFSVSSATNDGMEKAAYDGLPIPPYHHNPSPSALPMSASLYQVNTSSFPDLDHGSLSSPTSISSPSKTTNEEYHHHHHQSQQQQLEALSPLPTNASMYTSHFTPRNGIDAKAQAPPLEMIQQQQQQTSMTWKQDMYSSPASTNGPWTQQQPNDIYYPATPTPGSSSCSPPPPPPQHHRAMPPCNCAPMMPYAPPSVYNGSNAALPPFGSSSTSSPHRSPSNHYPSYQHPSMDHSYDLTLNLSPSSSSSLSDDYYPPSHHHQHHHHYRRQRHSVNSNTNIMGAHPPLSSSSSSSSSSSAHRGTPASATTPRRYKCTVCVKRFTRPSSLATHMHSHTGEKPYKCMVDGCGRRFSVVSNLRRHAKIHLHANSLIGVSGRKLDLAS